MPTPTRKTTFNLPEAVHKKIAWIAKKLTIQDGRECDNTEAVCAAILNYGGNMTPIRVPDYGEVPGDAISLDAPPYAVSDVITPLLMSGEGRFCVTYAGEDLPDHQIFRGAKLVIQPQAAPEPGRIALAVINGRTCFARPEEVNGQTALYELRPDGKRRDLQFNSERGDRVLGVVVGCVRKF